MVHHVWEGTMAEGSRSVVTGVWQLILWSWTVGRQSSSWKQGWDITLKVHPYYSFFSPQNCSHVKEGPRVTGLSCSIFKMEEILKMTWQIKDGHEFSDILFVCSSASQA